MNAQPRQSPGADEDGSCLPGLKPERTLGTTGLVLGLFSLFLGVLAGIPAVVLSAFSLAREPRARGRSIAGIVLGMAGTLSSAVLVPLVVTTLSRRIAPGHKVTDAETTVTYAMYLVHGSLNEWAEANAGAYPSEADFNSDSSRFMAFLARNRVG